MSFDKTTRNLLEKTVAVCRDHLKEDIRNQLQSNYGLYPDGTAIDVARTERERQAASDLRDLLEHFAASESSTDERARKAAYKRLVREIGFTALNRLAALRLCEERGLIVECVREGMESDGFRLYDQLTGGALGNRYQTYRVFLLGIFDELALDLGVLFDRDTPQSHYFPSETALNAILEQLTNQELDLLNVWKKDETIGWIYQDHNDPIERDKMKSASRSPRNTYEMAVRNQFFTPRYVVEFLTDNTLGRIWYEMRSGDTRLIDECQYLIRTEEQQSDIPNRPKEDPRDLKILDPACGSGHFLLYAFDLLITIYEEAWEDNEIQPFTETGTWLAYDYLDLKDLRRALPGLILRHNLCGVDIDARAVQIAALALWLRAQRFYQELDLKPLDRPRIIKTNLIAAEPMPGDRELIDEFVAFLNPPLVGALVQLVFEKMKLAGEAGTLLKIERDLKENISQAKRQWLSRPKAEQLRLWKKEKRPVAEQLPLFDVSGITDNQFWDKVEEQVLDALRDYAERNENGRGTKRNLFVEDAAQGFAFVDLSRQKYDVVLMNPPFGALSRASKYYIEDKYPDSKGDILAHFVERGLELSYPSGLVGAITSRTPFYLGSMSNFRETILQRKGYIRSFADLGEDVLDAMVETATYTVQHNPQYENFAVFFRMLIESDKASKLLSAVSEINQHNPDNNTFIVNPDDYSRLEGSPYCYWIDGETINLLSKAYSLEDYHGSVRVGLQTGKDFRFLRMFWEVDPSTIVFNKYDYFTDIENFLEEFSYQLSEDKYWVPFSKTDYAAPWFSPIMQLVNWHRDGKEIKNFYNEKGVLRSAVRSPEYYYHPGFSYMLRSTRLVPYIVPSGGIPTAGRSQVYANEGEEYELLGYCASNVASSVARFSGEAFARPKFQAGMVKSLPVPKLDKDTVSRLERLITDEINDRRSTVQGYEPCLEFTRPAYLSTDTISDTSWNLFTLLGETLEMQIAQALSLTERQYDQLIRDLREAVAIRNPFDQNPENGIDDTQEDTIDDVVSAELVDQGDYAINEGLLSYIIGVIVGRWDIRIALNQSLLPKLQNVFAPLSVCPPGSLVSTNGLPAESGSIASEAWLRARPDVITLPEITDQGVINDREGREQPATIPNSEYPVSIQWDGILVDDPGLDGKSPHPSDIVLKVREVLKILWPENHVDVESVVCESLGMKDLREYFRKPANFFADHLDRYTKSRRKAPIYWPLSTSSGSYTLWIYYQRLSDEILYTAVNRYVEPKIESTGRHISALEKEIARLSGRAASVLKDRIDDAREFIIELREFRDEILRIAALPYKPNLNDGVIINAAPFHRLFGLTKWAEHTERTWSKLKSGEYDWAHLAYAIWPDRVREVCKKDNSIAIAHGLEGLYQE